MVWNIYSRPFLYVRSSRICVQSKLQAQKIWFRNEKNGI